MAGQQNPLWTSELEVADLLWCFAHLDRILTPPASSPPPKPIEPSISPTAGADVSGRQDLTPASTIPDISEPRTPIYPKTPSSQDLSENILEDQTLSRASPVRIPDPFPLPQPFETGKALLPLGRRVPGVWVNEIDIDQTVNQIAEANGLPMLAYKAPLERWFDLHILIDVSPSMEFWGELAESVGTLFQWQGIFRDVRVWHFETNQAQTPRLVSGSERIEQDIRSLLAPGQNRLFVVVTDTLGQAWQSGIAFERLAVLGQRHPVTIAHVFPKRLWLRTAMLDAVLRPLTSPHAGCANTQLRETPPVRAAGPHHRFPILNISAAHLRTWANFTAGGRGPLQGVLIKKNTLEDVSLIAAEEMEISSALSESPDSLLDCFYDDASSEAQSLAKVLAAVPLIPPVMRLAQQRYLSGTEPSHLAEVFFSGLIQRSDVSEKDESVQDAWYDFLPGIREKLLKYSSVQQTAQIHREISDFVEERYGSPRDFSALIPNEMGTIDSVDLDRASYFAEVRGAVLMTWGGEYAEWGRQLLQQAQERKQRKIARDTTVPSDLDTDFPGIPPLDDFLFAPPKISFEEALTLPPVEKQWVEVATIAFEDSRYRFEFERVKLVRASELPIERPRGETLFYQGDRLNPPSPSSIPPYPNFEALSQSEREGVDYQIRIREQSREVAIVAPHGGNIEPGTSEIADAIAGDELSFYSLDGLKEQGNDVLGLPRTSFDEPQSLKLLAGVTRVLEVHGVPFPGSYVVVGGTDREWIKRLENAIEASGFGVRPPARGTEAQELCNRGVSGIGVYLDLTQGFRQLLFSSDIWRDSGESSFERFVRAIRSTIPELNSTWSQQRERGVSTAFREDLGDGISLEMVYIPSGTFMMGSVEEDPYNNEKPQHHVTVPEFHLGRYPITQSQWRAVAALPKIERHLEPNPSRFPGDDHPVEQVSWFEAVEFCQRLSQHTGRDYRLPSEAEWEYACRAGTTTAFHFGDMITTDVASYNGSAFNDGPEGRGRSQTTPVSEFGIANPFGLCDMHGNVWEWCLDSWHENYGGAPTDGSAWIEGGEGDYRICRGGSWVYNPAHCRSASRNFLSPDFHNLIIGFRVVCAVRVTP